VESWQQENEKPIAGNNRLSFSNILINSVNVWPPKVFRLPSWLLVAFYRNRPERSIPPMAAYILDPSDTTFTQILNRILFDTTLSMGARLTYAALVEHNRQGEKCWPSMARLGTMVGVCARTIQNYIKELIARGLVTVLKRGCWSRANEYRLNALVPPQTAPESQREARTDMRNPGVGDTRNRQPAQLYPTNKGINNWKKRVGEAGAMAFMRRRGIKI
jgi:hypothetical protein